jgi:hypothetical protein
MKFMVHHAMVGSACEDGVKLTITNLFFGLLQFLPLVSPILGLL